MKSIGIGCFHFGISYEKGLVFSTRKYVEDVKAALGKISSIGEISINYEKKFEEEFLVTEKPLGFRYGEIFPHVEFLRVDFRLYIPERIQVLPLEGGMSAGTNRNRKIQGIRCLYVLRASCLYRKR